MIRMQNKGVVGLYTLVGTLSLIAALLDMRFKYAFPAILVGNIIAGLIIMVLSNGVFTVLAR